MSKINMYADVKKALFIEGKRITDYIFDEIFETQNEFVLYSNSIINIYDKNTGEKLFEYIKKEGDVFKFSIEGFFSVENNGEFWLYSIRGKIFSKFSFDDYIVPERYEILRRIIVYKCDKCGVYTFEGDKILECEYEDINLFKNAINAQLEDGTTHLYSLNGKLIFIAKYRDEWRTEPAGIVKSSNNKCGLYSLEGKVILPEIYDDIYFTDMYKYNKIEWIKVKKDDKYGVVDFNGNEILPIEFDQIRLGEGIPHSPHDYILVKKNNKYGVYSNDGKLQIPIEYEYLKYYRKDTSCQVCKDGTWGFYFIPKKQFVIADEFNITKTGKYEILVNGKWQMIKLL